MAKGKGKKKKAILLIMDGLGDRPVRAFHGKTPLESARTPNLDRLAKEGACGKMLSVSGIYPASDVSHLSIFGYPLSKYYTGRGVFECAGIGMKLKKGDVALRTNFGTVDGKLNIVDRRAGRIENTAPFVRALNGVKIKGVKFILKGSVGHRAGLVMRGKGLSHKISDGDPHKLMVKAGKVRALDKSKKAKFTAEVLNEFLALAHEKLREMPANRQRVKSKKLPANYLLVRGASIAKDLPSFKKRYMLKACCIAGGGLYKGIAGIVGMEVLKVKGATGGADTDVVAKFKAAKRALKSYDFAFVHVKATDIMGEDGNCKGKRKFIEKVDRAAKELFGLGKKGVLLAVTADHSTPCSLKDHSKDRVPFMLHGAGVKADSVNEFGERACEKGVLGNLRGLDVMPKICAVLRK